MTGKVKENALGQGSLDVHIASCDAKFARMLQLVLEEDGIRSTVVSSYPKKRCFTVVDTDTVKIPSQCVADITVSRDEQKEPTFVRPFENEEFVRYIKGILSFTGEEDEDFTLVQGAVLYKGAMIPLSDIEYTIMKLLLERRGEAVSSAEIKEVVWQGDEKGNSLVVYINYLRKKLDFRFGKRFIVTVRGMGYMLAGNGR